MKRIASIAIFAVCAAACALAAAPAAAQEEEIHSAHIEGTPPAPMPGPNWHFSRMVDGDFTWQTELVFLKEIVTHFQPDPNQVASFPSEIYFVPTPIRKGEETPNFPEGVKWFVVFRPGVGTLYIRQTAENESWHIKSDDFEVLADKPVDPNATVSFSWELTSADGQSVLGPGEAMIGCGAWALLGINGVYEIAYMSPGSYPECAPPEFTGHVWVNVPIPAEYGAFYGLAHEPGQVWTVTIGDGTYSASAVEADPNPPTFDAQAKEGECST